VRPEYEDNLYDFLEQLEKGVRQIPLSGKKISLNFLGSRAFNSHANTAISQFFAKVNHQDVIRLKVLFPKIQSFEKLAKNLNSLRSTTNNENVQVVVFDDKKQ
jgi:flavodoxin